MWKFSVALGASLLVAACTTEPDTEPAEPDTGETTVIVVSDHFAPTVAIGVLEPPSNLPRSVGTTIPGWDPATLHQIELALASFVGPMAKVLVRQAAKTHFDWPTLTTAISQHLSTDEDRKRFNAKLVAATGGSKITTGGSRVTTAGSKPTAASSAGNGQPLAPEAVAAAQRVLTSHIGPIASIVVKKAAAKASTQEQLYVLLAEHVSEGAERQKLLAALHKKA
jgi:serine/threonine-protein kinase